MIEPDDLPNPLTPMQTGIAACMLEGMTDKQTARAIGITPETVEWHRHQMVKRLRLKNTRMLLIELARMTA